MGWIQLVVGEVRLRMVTRHWYCLKSYGPMHLCSVKSQKYQY